MVRISWSWSGLYEHLTKDEKASFQKCLRKLRDLDFEFEPDGYSESQYDFVGDYDALKADSNAVRRIISVYNKMVEIQWAIHERFKPLIAEKKIGKRFSVVSRTAFNISIARLEWANELQLTHAAQSIIKELAFREEMLSGGFPWSGRNHYVMEFISNNRNLDSDYVYKSETGVKATKPLDRILSKAKMLAKQFNVVVESMRIVIRGDVNRPQLAIDMRLKVR
jgi:hypothetical protein